MILKKKKGFTLIETVLGISIAFMVIIILLDTTIFFIKDFTVLKQETQNYSDMTEGLNYIDYLIKDRLQSSVQVRENTLIIEVKGVNKYYITKINGDVMEDYGVGTRHKIIKNVKDFQIDVKNNLAYVKVTPIKGESIERCFPIVVK